MCDNCSQLGPILIGIQELLRQINNKLDSTDYIYANACEQLNINYKITSLGIQLDDQAREDHLKTADISVLEENEEELFYYEECDVSDPEEELAYQIWLEEESKFTLSTEESNPFYERDQDSGGQPEEVHDRIEDVVHKPPTEVYNCMSVCCIEEEMGLYGGSQYADGSCVNEHMEVGCWQECLTTS